jgi:BASS family bile acid:Na+ symporter
MEAKKTWLSRLSRSVQRHFLGLLLAAYGLAAVLPGPGVAARQVSAAQFVLSHESIAITLPMLMLAGLLFNAALSTEIREAADLLRRPHVLVSGWLVNLVAPVSIIAVLVPALEFWHNREETQNLLVGLALVAAMPIAGSSTAWSQNANGNLPLSLGLVILSTLLSPITTPLVLKTFGTMASADHASALQSLSGRQTGMFLMLCVALPSLAGLLTRQVVGGDRAALLRPRLKLLNSILLLLLCYTNASAALPEMVSQPDWDFLALALGVVIALSISTFAAGWVLARVLKVDHAQKRSLLFGLGMSNNGTGMVLAGSALPGLPEAVLPVLAYNLIQHLVAGGVNWSLCRSTEIDVKRLLQNPA